MSDIPEAPQKRGRPAGSKNKPREPLASSTERLAVVTEAPQRREMRPEAPRAGDDSRDAASKRAAEIMANFDGTEGNDDFKAPEPPPGWTYEWKRKTVYNQEDPAYMIALRRTGWAEVPAKRHPEMMPLGHKGSTIERKGQILMERPKEITDMFKDRDRKAARDQVRTKEEQLSAVSKDQFERKNKDSSLVRITKQYEPMQIPDK